MSERIVFAQSLVPGEAPIASAFVSHKVERTIVVAAGQQGPAGAQGEPGQDGPPGDVSAHEAAADPHPQYTTAAEASAAAPVQSVAGRTGAVTLAKADVGLGNVDNKSSATIRGEITGANVTTALGFTPENTSNKGAANGYAGLDGGGKVPSAYLPSYVDDVLEYANVAAFPATGESGKLYVALDDGKTYRWSGSAYVLIVSSPGTTDAVTEGATNLYFSAQRVRDAILTGLSTATNAAITAADSVLSAFGKLQAQISGKVSKSGDSMTGPLNISASTTPQVLTATGSYKDATQVIPNSEFADASSWILSGGWTISGGKLCNPTAVAGNISVPLTGLVAGASYVIEVGMTTPGCYFLPSSDAGVTQKSHWRYWESPHFGFVAPSASFTLTLSQNYVTAAVEIDYIRMYKVISNADRIQQGVSATSTTFDLTASGSSFGLGGDALKNGGNALNSVAIGKNAMAVAVRPSGAIAIGVEAMKNAQGPADSVAVGYQTLMNLSIGSDCIGVGSWGCLTNLTTAMSVVAIGSGAGQGITTGALTTIYGVQALPAITTGTCNSAFGFNAGNSLNANSQLNTIVGFKALSIGTAGAYHNMSALGSEAFYSGPYSDSTCIGRRSAVTGTLQVQLGQSGTTAYAYGAVQDRSDRRDKSDIRPTILGLDFIKALTPVDFKWDMRDDYRTEIPDELSENLHLLRREKHRIEDTGGDATIINAQIDTVESQIAVIVDGNQLDNLRQNGKKKRSRYHHGLIAQDVRQVMNALGVDFGGFQNHKLSGGQDVLSIGYTELIGPLIKAVQDQNELIVALQDKVSALEKTIAKGVK